MVPAGQPRRKTTKPDRVRIQIDSQGEDVNIKGDVGSNKLVEAVVTIAQKVEGVKKIANNLRVGSSWHW